MDLDALNRRRKFVGRQPTGKWIDPTPRDLAYFAALERHGPLPGPVLFEFAKHTARNERGHKDRLTDLYHEASTRHGGPYLERPVQQFANLHARYAPMTYELTKFATRALREASIPPQIAAPPSGPYLHRFMTAKITAETELEAKRQGYRYVSSGEILRHAKCPESTRSASNPLAIRVGGRTLIPDALYGIDYGGKYRFFALEADRGTEPINGRDRASKYLSEKLAAYAQVLRTEAFRSHWGIPVLTVRIVTESAERAENIEKVGVRCAPLDCRTQLSIETLT